MWLALPKLSLGISPQEAIVLPCSSLVRKGLYWFLTDERRRPRTNIRLPRGDYRDGDDPGRTHDQRPQRLTLAVEHSRCAYGWLPLSLGSLLPRHRFLCPRGRQ